MIFFLDIEYQKGVGEMPAPLLAVGLYQGSDDYLHFDFKIDDDVKRLNKILSEDITLVAFFLPAEISCLMTLNLNIPKKMLDLYVEYRWMRNGDAQRWSLLEVAKYFGIETMSEEEKERLRTIAINGPKTVVEKKELANYCEEDVRVLKEIYLKYEEFDRLSKSNYSWLLHVYYYQS